jgi:small conductance mechanosensitive channel
MDLKKVNITHIIERFTDMLVDYSPRVLMAIFTLIIGFWVANRISKLFRRSLMGKNLDPTIVPFIGSFISVLIKVLVVVSVATKFGIETTSFVAMIGGAGLAVGLALQGSLSHFASGILILIFKPYRVGDTITAGGQTGKVLEILILQTILKSAENHKVIIPNGAIMSGTIINLSALGAVKVGLNFTIAGNSDTEKVRNVVKNVAHTCELVHKIPEVTVTLDTSDLGATKIDIKVTCDAADTATVKDYLYEAIKIAFDQNGIVGPAGPFDHLTALAMK